MTDTFSDRPADAPIWLRMANRHRLASLGYSVADIATVEGTHPNGVSRWVKENCPRHHLRLYLTDTMLAAIERRRDDGEPVNATICRLLAEILPENDDD